MRSKILKALLAIPFCFVSYNVTAQVPGTPGPVLEHASLISAQQEAAISDIGSHPDDAPAIRNMVRQGVMTTVSGDKFQPEAEVTRAEFAQSIQRLFNLSHPKQASQFSDVTSATPGKNEIEALAPFMNRQVVCFTCALSTNFYPNEPITGDLALVTVVGILSSQKKIEMVTDEEAKDLLSRWPEFQQGGPAATLYFATAIKLDVLPTPRRYLPVVRSTRADLAVLFDHVQTKFAIPTPELRKR